MGLDQYLFSCEHDEVLEGIWADLYEKYPNDLKEPEEGYERDYVTLLRDRLLVGEWRKHANLQEYIETMYGVPEEVNCRYVELSEPTIHKIIRLSKEHNLPHGEGFFWGETEPQQNEDTVEIMEKALEEMGKGRRIFYYAWY